MTSESSRDRVRDPWELKTTRDTSKKPDHGTTLHFKPPLRTSHPRLIAQRQKLQYTSVAITDTGSGARSTWRSCSHQTLTRYLHQVFSRRNHNRPEMEDRILTKVNELLPSLNKNYDNQFDSEFNQTAFLEILKVFLESLHQTSIQIRQRQQDWT